jgi:hypothetical protein
MRRGLSLLGLLLVVSVVGWGISIDPAISYNVTTGNQIWTGALSFAFQVNSPIVVNALGLFDHNGDGLKYSPTAPPFYVEIRQITNLGSCPSGTPCTFSAAGTTLAGLPTVATLVSGVSPLVGNARWQAVPLTTLTPGYYMLTAVGYNLNELNYNAYGILTSPGVLNTFGGAVTWGVGPDNYGNAYGTGMLPSIWDGGPVIRYAAGTFSVVPEPATYALIGTVGLALYLLRRRKAGAKS